MRSVCNLTLLVYYLFYANVLLWSILICLGICMWKEFCYIQKFVGKLIKEERNFRIHMEILSYPPESFALSEWIIFSISCAVDGVLYIGG